MTSEQHHSTKLLKEGWTSEINGISLSLSDLLRMTSHSPTGQDTPLPVRFTVLKVGVCSLLSGVRVQSGQNPYLHFV